MVVQKYTDLPGFSHAFRAAALLVLCGLAACADNPLVDIYHTVRNVSGTNNHVDVEKYRTLPYASMAVRPGGGSFSVLVLERAEQDDLYWQAPDRAVLVTRRGRLVETAGLTTDLSRTFSSDPDPLAEGHPDSKTWRREIDADRSGFFGLAVEGKFVDLGEENIDLFGATRRLRHWREDCEAKATGWRFSNDFWIDSADGRVWKSVQYYLPTAAPMELILIKPARTD